jgi:hypothetical protein
MRPRWKGVTSVDVYGGFGQSTDWTMPFLSLTNDGSGTFTGTHALPNGTYNYYFRVHGSADALVHDGTWLLDEENPSFAPHPAGAPLGRSVSTVTVPQAPAAPLYHLKGAVLFGGQPQSCYSVQLEAGELIDAGHVVSEHTTANFAESAADGTFDFPVAAGPFGLIVKFPFGMFSAYPDPKTTPSVGVARQNVTVSGDVTMPDVDISYPDYALMSPTDGGTFSLPVTFHFTVVPGSTGANPSITATNIAGNDPAWYLPPSMNTTGEFDGGIAYGLHFGQTYWWGAWQNRGTWREESLLFPIVFQ